MMLLVVELAAIDEAAAVKAAAVVDDYLESLLGRGLLKYRVARQVAKHPRLMLIEEWTDAAAHDASQANNPDFDALQTELAPLLAEFPHATEYEIVSAGIASE